MEKLSSTLGNMLLSLTGICVIVSGILALVNKVTTAPIAAAAMKAKVAAISAVTPAFDNNPYAEQIRLCLEGDSDSLSAYPARLKGQLVGYALESYTLRGFGGRIAVMVGFDTAGKLVDYSVLEHSESPGLGSLIPEWYHQPSLTGGLREMRGIDMSHEAPLSVTKDGGRVDAITAATISSRAFLDALNRAYRAYQILQQRSEAPESSTTSTTPHHS